VNIPVFSFLFAMYIYIFGIFYFQNIFTMQEKMQSTPQYYTLRKYTQVRGKEENKNIPVFNFIFAIYIYIYILNILFSKYFHNARKHTEHTEHTY